MVATSHAQLLGSIADSPIAFVVTDATRPDNPIVVANPAFCELTGYARDEVVGRNCRFLTGPGTDNAARDTIRAAIADGRPVLVDILNYRKDGTPFRNGVMITPLFDDAGQLRYYLGSQVDLGPEPLLLLGRQDQAAAKVAELPQRQRQVLTEMSRGLLNKQIAHRLGISEKTVKMHRALLIERLGVTTSAEAIRTAVEAGL